MNKILLKKGISKKNNSSYVGLFFDLGYIKKNLSFDTRLIVELLGISYQEFNDLLSKLSNDVFIDIGSFEINIRKE